MSDFLDLQGAKDLNTDAIHIGAVANSVDPVTGAKIDEHVNRVGGTDYTLQGFWNALGPVVMPWTSATGGTLTQPNQAFLHPADGNYYSWGGAYPVGGYVVAPGTDPTAVAGYVPRTDVVLRDELTGDGGAGLVGGIEVTAESFGVVSGLVSLPVARTNADKIMNKAAELSASGGGKIIFTKPLYQVHMDEADYDSSPTNFRIGALKIPYSNVILKGQGWFSTTIQAYNTDAAYEVIQWSASPLENGITKISGVGLHDICIDGNYHGDYTPGSYARQSAGVRGAGIKGLSISRLRVINTSHYGLALQNGGYIGCNIDGYWAENLGADGIDIKDNEGVSRAFKLNNIVVLNFGQLDEPAHPWAGLDVMSVAPEISNVYVSDFGDKGAIDAGFRLKNGTEGQVSTRGTGGIFANANNITVIQNRFKDSPSTIIGVDFRACNVNYSNIVVRGTASGRIGGGVSLEERYCQGVNVQISNVITGYSATNGPNATDRNYGDAEGCKAANLTIVDAITAVVTTRKHQKFTDLSLINCVNGLTSNSANAGPVTVTGLYMENVSNPFGGLATNQNQITGVYGPGSTNFQAGLGTFKDGSGNLATTTILSKNGVRAYVNSTEVSAGTEVARFAAASSMILAPLIVTGAVQPSTGNTYTCGSINAPWSGGFTQTAFTVTSDERYKSAPEEITDAMLDAAAEVDWCMFQYLDRVEEKGADGARWHFGAIAQRFVEAFQKHGLDPFRFAFICYDEWDAKDEVVGEDGAIVSEAVSAGSRYGIRYEQAIILKQKQIERDHNRRIDSLLSRIEALEAK